jgi:hypothetical protein
MSGSILQKALLVPVNATSGQALMDQKIQVQFNPETLKLSYTVTVKADTGSKNSASQAAQQSSSSSAKLAVDLVFDTTDIFEDKQDGADVRVQFTSKIVSAFVAPANPATATPGKPVPANPCLFLWGTYQFAGLVDSYNETLEFWSASGVPLRASVSISLTENRYNLTGVPGRVPGQAQPLPPGSQIGPALSAAGANPADWRGAALANGLESPRFSAGGSIDVGIGAGFGASANAAAGMGFSVGSSADLGTSIPGAFTAASGTVANAGFGFSL